MNLRHSNKRGLLIRTCNPPQRKTTTMEMRGQTPAGGRYRLPRFRFCRTCGVDAWRSRNCPAIADWRSTRRHRCGPIGWRHLRRTPTSRRNLLRNEVLRLNADGQVTQYSILPQTPVDPSGAGESGVLGLAADLGGALFAALVSPDSNTRGVYKITAGGSHVERLAGSGKHDLSERFGLR